MRPSTQRGGIRGTTFTTARAGAPEEDWPEPDEVRPRARGRTQITEQDVALLTWIGRHGVVSAHQVARRFFGGVTPAAIQRACRRLAMLAGSGLLLQDYSLRGSEVVWLSRAGARLTLVPVTVPRWRPEAFPRDLVVVDLVEELLAAHPGSEATTRREVRFAHRRSTLCGTRPPGWGRTPDAALTFPDGSRVAVEIGLSSMCTTQYRRVIKAYREESYDAVWWYVPTGDVHHVRRLIAEHGAFNIAVREAPPAEVVHPEITALEVQILKWIAHHGVVTEDQVARRFFTREDGHIGKRAVSNRLRKLEWFRYLNRRIPVRRHPSVYRVTERGARAVGVVIRHVGWIPTSLEHDLASVDLLEHLLAQNPGTSVRTKREIFTELVRRVHRLPTYADGLIPTGELLLPFGLVVMVQLDISPRSTAEVKGFVRRCLASEYDSVWWFVRPGSVERMREALTGPREVSMITLVPWKHLRRRPRPSHRIRLSHYT